MKYKGVFFIFPEQRVGSFTTFHHGQLGVALLAVSAIRRRVSSVSRRLLAGKFAVSVQIAQPLVSGRIFHQVTPFT